MRARANVALRSWLKRTLLAVASRLSGRHAVLLPSEASHEEMTIDLRAPYRVEGATLTVDLNEPCAGRLTATLLAYDNYFPTRSLWTGSGHYPGPSGLTVDLKTGVVSLAGQEWGRVGPPLPTRRFCWRLALTGTDGIQRGRLTGHYVPVMRATVGSDYFCGDNYVDHEAESAADHRQIVELLQRHHGREPVLEIGCATGGLLAELDATGLRSFGLDVSEWAVNHVGERLGPGRAWVCDVEHDPLPAPMKANGPFGVLVLSSVFEHFRDPFAVLAKITAIAAPGAVLVITTTNAAGLTHALFGAQWEGYFDWTHLGIDRVSAKALRDQLPRLGWRIAQLTTHRVWDGDADPTRATLREWWVADARFRRLLTERDLGDFITCIAVKA
jgi:SAM-dependent methyltransferase